MFIAKEASPSLVPLPFVLLVDRDELLEVIGDVEGDGISIILDDGRVAGGGDSYECRGRFGLVALVVIGWLLDDRILSEPLLEEGEGLVEALRVSVGLPPCFQ